MELRRVLAPLAVSCLIVQGCGIESRLTFLTSAAACRRQDGGEAPGEGGAVFCGLSQRALWMQPPQQKKQRATLTLLYRWADRTLPEDTAASSDAPRVPEDKAWVTLQPRHLVIFSAQMLFLCLVP